MADHIKINQIKPESAQEIVDFFNADFVKVNNQFKRENSLN